VRRSCPKAVPKRSRVPRRVKAARWQKPKSSFWQARTQATCGGLGAALGREAGAGAGAAGARGGPGAAPSREAGVGAVGACVSPRATPSREAGAVVLT
jgi:hypothetical protein